MDGFKTVPVSKRKTDFLFSLGLGILAALVYGLTVSHGLFPGESAELAVHYTGLSPLSLPLHPVWGWIVHALGTLNVFPLALRLNLFSALCSVVSVVAMYRLVSFFLHDTIVEEYSIEYAPRVAVWGGAVAAVAFLFSAPVWQSAVRLQYQSFDLMLVFLCAGVLARYAVSPRAWILFLFGILYGVGIGESVMFLSLAPVFLALLVYVMWKNATISLSRAAWVGVVIVLTAAGVYWQSAASFFATYGAELEMNSTYVVLVQVIREQVKILANGFPRVNWLILLLMGLVPWLAGTFASFRALNNERSWSEYILHLTLTILVVLGLANAPFSAWGLLRPFGRLPVASAAMIAMTAGYLVAYWYLMLKVTRPKRGQSVSSLTMRAGDWLGLLLTYPLAVFVGLVAVVNAFSCSGTRGAFADRCAGEILDRLGDRTWFVTDGTLDPHLLLLAKERGKELNLICLQKDMDPAYLRSMARKIAEKKIFDDKTYQRMKSTLDLGILPFIQDWFAFDKEIEKKVAVFGVPDFWYTAECVPVPEFFFFGGTRDIKPLAKKPLLSEYQSFWTKMDKTLAPNRNKSKDPVVMSRVNLRRHMGFVANNLGVLLEDLAQTEKTDGRKAEAKALEQSAYKTYCAVHDTIDPQNISALFNRFEMARHGVEAASAQKDAIERELKDFINGLKFKYPLYSLSRIYGYVRVPELFAKLGWGWALSGQTGAALAGVNRAIHLLPTDQRSGALETMAAIYALAEDKKKTEAVYQDMIKQDPNNRAAFLGLARLSIQEGSVDKARAWLEKAGKSSDKRGALGVEWAVIHLMNGDVAQARLSLQEATDLQPKNLQAWAMLAMVQIQQDETDDVAKVTLPKMESIAGTSNNYFLQITRAQLAMKRASMLKNDALKGAQREAREAFIRASMLRPEIAGVKDMILQLDIEMNDQKSAELHARQVLRQNRKHYLANYVMGSLRLQEGQYGEAEDFLRRSVEEKPVAAALNDLAEVLHRIKRLDQAELYARQAVQANNKLYVSWETLGAVLLEQNKNLDEAERCVKKALELYADDLRVKITLARIYLKKGEVEQARTLLHQIKSRQGELPVFDQEELIRVMSQAAAAKIK